MAPDVGSVCCAVCLRDVSRADALALPPCGRDRIYTPPHACPGCYETLARHFTIEALKADPDPSARPAYPLCLVCGGRPEASTAIYPPFAHGAAFCPDCYERTAHHFIAEAGLCEDCGPKGEGGDGGGRPATKEPAPSPGVSKGTAPRVDADRAPHASEPTFNKPRPVYWSRTYSPDGHGGTVVTACSHEPGACDGCEARGRCNFNKPTRVAACAHEPGRCAACPSREHCDVPCREAAGIFDEGGAYASR